jgi:hypothetical protein
MLQAQVKPASLSALPSKVAVAPSFLILKLIVSGQVPGEYVRVDQV